MNHSYAVINKQIVELYSEFILHGISVTLLFNFQTFQFEVQFMSQLASDGVTRHLQCKDADEIQIPSHNFIITTVIALYHFVTH